MGQWPANLATFLLAWVPYLIVTWLISKFLDEGFWLVLAWVVAARLFFALIDFASSFLGWHSIGKRRLTAALLSHLAANKMPHRYYRHDDYSNYFQRVKDDPASTRDMKEAARQAELMALFWEEQGIFPGVRFSSAMEVALEQYSPRASAPELRSQHERTAEEERAIERAEEEFATFDPEIMELDRQYEALGDTYYPGVAEESQRILNARKHRVIAMLRERGLMK